MTFEKLIEQFANHVEEEKNGLTSVTYKRKIYVFYEYVVLELQAKDVNYQSILTGIKVNELLNSLEYYVKNYDVKYATTAWNYISVVTVFYQYIYEEFGWENKLFENKSEKAELNVAYDNKIKELKLNRKEQVHPLSDAEAEQLINACNEKLSIADDDEILNGYYNGVFANYISSLACKIILLYGTKNNVINELKITDYNGQLNKLKINGFWVHLPDELSLQMQRYMKVRDKLIENPKDDRLFVDIAKERDKIDYSKMFNILKEVVGHNKGMAVAKYGIMQMIRSGVPSHVIKEFTGYANDVYNHCLELVDEQDGIMMMREKSKLLDATFRKTSLYDMM